MCKNINKMKDWYKTHLGFDMDAYDKLLKGKRNRFKHFTYNDTADTTITNDTIC